MNVKATYFLYGLVNRLSRMKMLFTIKLRIFFSNFKVTKMFEYYYHYFFANQKNYLQPPTTQSTTNAILTKYLQYKTNQNVYGIREILSPTRQCLFLFYSYNYSIRHLFSHKIVSHSKGFRILSHRLYVWLRMDSGEFFLYF